MTSAGYTGDIHPDISSLIRNDLIKVRTVFNLRNASPTHANKKKVLFSMRILNAIKHASYLEMLAPLRLRRMRNVTAT